MAIFPEKPYTSESPLNSVASVSLQVAHFFKKKTNKISLFQMTQVLTIKMAMVAVCGALFFSIARSFAIETPEKMEPVLIHEARQQTDNRCNINLCFALDGNSNITRGLFNSQRILVHRVVSAIAERNGNVKTSAVQYGVANEAISPLTDSVPTFLDRLNAARMLNQDGNFVISGLSYCFSQLFSEMSRNPSQVRSEIVVFGRGMPSSFGDVNERAAEFNSIGGGVVSVGLGRDQNITGLLGTAGNDKQRVFSLRGRRVIDNVAEQMVQFFCD